MYKKEVLHANDNKSKVIMLNKTWDKSEMNYYF